MIKCTLKEVNEYVQSESKKKKFGRYHGSNFWDVPEYGTKNWIVGVYINIEEDVPCDMPVETLLEKCVEYLNQPEPRKKYQKKKPTPKYGILKPYRGKFVTRGGKEYISALLITDKKRNKMFWSEGPDVQFKKNN